MSVCVCVENIKKIFCYNATKVTGSRVFVWDLLFVCKPEEWFKRQAFIGIFIFGPRQALKLLL